MVGGWGGEWGVISSAATPHFPLPTSHSHSPLPTPTKQLEASMRRLAFLAVPLGLYASGCRESNAQTPASSRQQATSQTTSSKAQQGKGSDSSGRFVSHVEHIRPGGMPIPRGLVLRN